MQGYASICYLNYKLLCNEINTGQQHFPQQEYEVELFKLTTEMIKLNLTMKAPATFLRPNEQRQWAENETRRQSASEVLGRERT